MSTATYEAQIRAMNLNKDIERKMLKAIGVDVPQPLFETYLYDAPDGKKVHSAKVKGVSKIASGKLLGIIASNPTEFFSFMFENAEWFGVKFTPELTAVIDLLTGNVSEEEAE